MIEFELLEGKLIADPGEAGRNAIAPLAKILGVEVIQPTGPTPPRVHCSMTTDEFNRHLELQQMEARNAA